MKRALPILLAVACSFAWGYALALLIPRGLLAVLLGLAAGAVIGAVILEAWPTNDTSRPARAAGVQDSRGGARGVDC